MQHPTQRTLRFLHFGIHRRRKRRGRGRRSRRRDRDPLSAGSGGDSFLSQHLGSFHFVFGNEGDIPHYDTFIPAGRVRIGLVLYSEMSQKATTIVI
jgi:hypothetical protein